MKIRLRSPRFIFLFFWTLLLPQPGGSSPSPNIMEYFEKEISALDDAVSRCPATPCRLVHPSSVDEHLDHEVGSETHQDQGYLNEHWYFQNLWVRFRPNAGFSLPGMIKLNIVPELDLLWQREVPEGWITYNPKDPPSN